ncbi:hypothetical protein VB780_11385 [Leptolyngbya sp. CCNP1308]|nr:hypothetical protein [Leptolyngbya sp. CCNP1308]MEA5449174.1 hypothetical protein [Leptolyngbya sp. CCNP1308]
MGIWIEPCWGDRDSPPERLRHRPSVTAAAPSSSPAPQRLENC